MSRRNSNSRDREGSLISLTPRSSSRIVAGDEEKIGLLTEPLLGGKHSTAEPYLLNRGTGNYQSLSRGLDRRIMSQLPKELLRYVIHADYDITDYFKKPTTCNGCLGALLFPISCCTMLLVQKGFIAKTWWADEPVILGQGRHFLLDPTHSFVGLEELQAKNVISHGPIHIISVALGKLGIGMDRQSGKPMILTTGTHYIDNSFFRWEGFTDLTEPITQIGNMKVVRVEKGWVGYGYRGKTGELVIYPPGRHFIKPPDRYVDFLSKMIQITQLPEEIHESKDYVQIAVRASIYFQITNPAKALVTVQDIPREIKELGIATLQQIIKSSTLVDIAGTKVTYKDDSGKKVNEGGIDFYEKIHDQFMTKLRNVILDQWGIDINNIRIESLRISDTKLAQSISANAIKVSQLEVKHMMLAKQTDIIKVQANNEARQKKTAVKGETNAIILKANAEAAAIVTRARAERESKILLGEGEAQYSLLVQQTVLGAELAKMQIQADSVSGLEKIAYVPHLPNLLEPSGAGIFNVASENQK